MHQFKKIAFLGLISFVGVLWAAGNSPNLQGERIDTQALGGKDRTLLYASTDKPIYREGETAYFRAVVLSAADNTPLSNAAGQIQFKILSPRGAILHKGSAAITDSCAGLDWPIPKGTAGGSYKLVVDSPSLGSPITERSFELRAYRAPRLKTQVVFLRDGYGPGELISASASILRAEGGAPTAAKVTAIARLDGQEIFRQAGLSINAEGLCQTQFSLPQSIEVGEGSLSFVIEDGGVVETANKSLPILLQTLDICFYPEGGELVANVPNRVYVQALQPNGKPADLEGDILLKGSNTVVAQLRTEHEGRGSFSFTPSENADYVLKLRQPSQIQKYFELPKVLERGIALHVEKSVLEFGDKIEVQLSGTEALLAHHVTLCKREVELDRVVVPTSQKGDGVWEHQLELSAAEAEGVLMLTAWTEAGVPLAERLIFRRPRFAVNIQMEVTGPRVPGGNLQLQVTTTDEHQQPVEAIVGLSVNDDTVLEMIERREQAPRLPVMVYLENEVQDLADAQIYLDNNNPDAPKALDYLLGTQGWRRFVLVDHQEIGKKYKDEVARILAQKTVPEIRLARMRFKEEAMPMPMMAMAAAVEVVEKAVEEDAPIDDVVEALRAPIAENREVDLARPVVLEQLAEEEAVVARNDQLIAGKMLDRRERKNAIQWSVIREYAHHARPQRRANDRVDFAETLYWNAGIRTNPRTGRASVEFDLSDSITTFRVRADAFGRNGALGANDLEIQSIAPFSIEPKLPVDVVAGDQLLVPVAINNASSSDLEKIQLLVRSEKLQISSPKVCSLGAGERTRQMVAISFPEAGNYTIKFSASASGFSDSVTQSIRVLPRGFPMSHHFGGLLSSEQKSFGLVNIPEKVEANSLSVSAKIFPSPLANMEEALNALLRHPSGCFEQTSSTNYPVVMAQQYFASHQGIASSKISSTKAILEDGYKKLLGFECQNKGYEWFGQGDGHEALTAYGLMEFNDMSKVMNVDDRMLLRTRQWLLSRRDGQGSFLRNQKALDSFGGAPALTTDAYVIWALLEGGEDPSKLSLEIDRIIAKALGKEKNEKAAMDNKEDEQKIKKDQNPNEPPDSYIIALAANIAHLAKRPADALVLARMLSERVHADGYIEGSSTSITRSSGDSLLLETTSLAILAWLKDDQRWADHVEKSMQWVFECCKAGRFGTTQSTILALKCINAYDAARAVPKAPGSVQLYVDGVAFGSALVFDPSSKGALELPDFASALSAGEHRLELRMDKGSKMPFAIEVKYSTSLPQNGEHQAMVLKTSLSTTKVMEGEPLEMMVSLQSLDAEVPTPIAVLGLPASCEPRHAQLQELVASGRIASYEIQGRELILYWRNFAAHHSLQLPITLLATAPGTTTAPASRAYPYYGEEQITWVAGCEVEVVGK